jgi:hypothetical protein
MYKVNYFPKSSPSSRPPPAEVLIRFQRARQRQVSAGASNINSHRSARRYPILARSVPSRQISPREVCSKGFSCTRCDGQAIEASQHDSWLICAKRNVQLWYLITLYAASVCDGGSHGIQDGPETVIATRSTSSGQKGLGRAIGCASWHIFTGWKAIFGISRCVGRVGRVQVWIDVFRDTSDRAVGEKVLRVIHACIAAERRSSGCRPA